MRTRPLAVWVIVLPFFVGHAASEQLYEVYRTVSFDGQVHVKGGSI